MCLYDKIVELAEVPLPGMRKPPRPTKSIFREGAALVRSIYAVCCRDTTLISLHPDIVLPLAAIALVEISVLTSSKARTVPFTVKFSACFFLNCLPFTLSHY